MQCEYYPSPEDEEEQCVNEAVWCFVWPRLPDDDDSAPGMRLALLMCDECVHDSHFDDTWQFAFGL